MMQMAMMLALMASGQSGVGQGAAASVWPKKIESYVRKSVGCANRPFGYTQREMAEYPGQKHRLAYVNRLFGDVERVSTETDRLARRMLDGGYQGAMRAALEILGADASETGDAESPAVEITPVDDESAGVWAALPEEARRAVEQAVRGAAAAKPQLLQAFDEQSLGQWLGGSRPGAGEMLQAYNLAAGPWTGYGQWWSFRALDAFRPTALSRAALAFSPCVQSAIADLCRMDQAKVPDFESCRLKTPCGVVRILGAGDNTYRGGDAIVIDLGGDDRYSGRVAVPQSRSEPVGLLIDLMGDDLYDGRSAPASIACGVFGIGALFDLGGDDRYYCDASGLGCAWHGVGLLVDTAGNDLYSGRQWCEGAAHAGVGLLVDEAGDDRYLCQLESQGLGSTLGVGALIDDEGNDEYHAYDNENGRAITFPSAQTRSHEASMVQGAGYGRREDGGQSLAGGVGALIDGGGDDSYYGGVFSQAIGYWWSLGMLVDFGGNDRYRGVYYAQGAAAHFAVGSLVDHAGNDRYNDQGVLGQVLGAGRDGAVGSFVDAKGDDVYYIPKESAGAGDMNAMGLFCDQDGADTYRPFGYAYMGGVTSGRSQGGYYQSVTPTIGVFADLGGKDAYPPSSRAGNNTAWRQQGGGGATGFGFDTGPAGDEEKPQASDAQ